MSEWFQAKVKFAKQLDNGIIKQSTELYLIDAVSFTDAETRAFKEAGDNRDVQAVSIARSPIKEVVFYGDTDQWHKVKVCYSLMDEATEKEKKVTTYFLVNAADVKEAYERTEEHLKTMLVPFRIPKVEESQICEVFQYERPESVGPQNSAGAYYDLELTEDQKEMLRQRACYAENAPDSELFKGTPILQLPQIEIDRMRKLLKHFNEFGMSDDDDEHEEECAMEGDSIEAIDEDEERADTDLESRFDAAMKGGCDVG